MFNATKTTTMDINTRLENKLRKIEVTVNNTYCFIVMRCIIDMIGVFQKTSDCL